MTITGIIRKMRTNRFARPLQIVFAAVALAFLLNPAVDAKQPADTFVVNRYDTTGVPTFGLNERFYTETGDGAGRGFSITDYMEGPQFLSAFENFGGEGVLGFPVSRPFAGEDGLYYQITQRALLQWFPTERTTRLANLYQIMEEASLDELLFGQSIPRPLQDGAAGYEQAKSIRLAWMTEQALKTAFLQNPLVPGDESISIELYGLPMSRPEQFGPFITQRFQRIAFQYWVADVPGGQPVGTVVPVNGGDILKERLYAGTSIANPHLAGEIDIAGIEGSIAPAYTIDDALPDGYNIDDVTILRGIKVLEPLGAARDGLEAARVLQTSIDFTRLPNQVLGSFSSSNVIALSNQLRNQDIRALSVVLLHELVHLADWRANRIGTDFNSCVEAEARAITAEATAWGNLMGPNGKHPALTRLERLENVRLDLLQGVGDTIFDHAEDLYEEICAA